MDGRFEEEFSIAPTVGDDTHNLHLRTELCIVPVPTVPLFVCCPAVDGTNIRSGEGEAKKRVQWKTKMAETDSTSRERGPLCLSQ